MLSGEGADELARIFRETTVLLVLLDSVFVVVLIAGGALFVQYWFSDWIALYAMRARIVAPDDVGITRQPMTQPNRRAWRPRRGEGL